jgi:hypothetical protein
MMTNLLPRAERFANEGGGCAYQNTEQTFSGVPSPSTVFPPFSRISTFLADFSNSSALISPLVEPHPHAGETNSVDHDFEEFPILWCAPQGAHHKIGRLITVL